MSDSCCGVLQPRAQPCLQLLILLVIVHGCITNAVNRWCVATVMCGLLTPLWWLALSSFETSDCLLLWNKCLCAQNVLPFSRHDHQTGCSVIGVWAKHVTMVGWMTTCVLMVGSQHSHVKGPFLICSAALLARVVVRCTTCVRAHEGCFWLQWEVPTVFLVWKWRSP
jgi:hypothetical protein